MAYERLYVLNPDGAYMITDPCSAEKRDVLLRARHDFLEKTGGRLAVRKAIEKRQKKANQKEKRSRPSESLAKRQRPPSLARDVNTKTHKRKRHET